MNKSSLKATPRDAVVIIDAALRAAGEKLIPLPACSVLMARACVYMIAEGAAGTGRREAARRAWKSPVAGALDPAVEYLSRLGQHSTSCVEQEAALTQELLLAQAWAYLTYGARLQGEFLAEVPAWSVAAAVRLTHAAGMWMDGVDVDLAVQRADDIASGIPRPRKKRQAGEPLPDLTGRTLHALDNGLDGMPSVDLLAWIRALRPIWPAHGPANPWEDDQDIQLNQPDEWCRYVLNEAGVEARFLNVPPNLKGQIALIIAAGGLG